MKKKILVYLVLMNSTALRAGSIAASTYLTLGLSHEASAAIPALNWKAAAIVFIGAFVIEILSWLAQHPISQAILNPADVAALEPNPQSEIRNPNS